MADLVGTALSEKLVKSALVFEKDDAKGFFESCRKVFSEIVGNDVVEKKFHPLELKYLKG